MSKKIIASKDFTSIVQNNLGAVNEALVKGKMDVEVIGDPKMDTAKKAIKEVTKPQKMPVEIVTDTSSLDKLKKTKIEIPAFLNLVEGSNLSATNKSIIKKQVEQIQKIVGNAISSGYSPSFKSLPEKLRTLSSHEKEAVRRGMPKELIAGSDEYNTLYNQRFEYARATKWAVEQESHIHDIDDPSVFKTQAEYIEAVKVQDRLSKTYKKNLENIEMLYADMGDYAPKKTKSIILPTDEKLVNIDTALSESIEQVQNGILNSFGLDQIQQAVKKNDAALVKQLSSATQTFIDSFTDSITQAAQSIQRDKKFNTSNRELSKARKKMFDGIASATVEDAFKKLQEDNLQGILSGNSSVFDLSATVQAKLLRNFAVYKNKNGSGLSSKQVGNIQTAVNDLISGDVEGVFWSEAYDRLTQEVISSISREPISAKDVINADYSVDKKSGLAKLRDASESYRQDSNLVNEYKYKKRYFETLKSGLFNEDDVNDYIPYYGYYDLSEIAKDIRNTEKYLPLYFDVKKKIQPFENFLSNNLDIDIPGSINRLINAVRDYDTIIGDNPIIKNGELRNGYNSYFSDEVSYAVDELLDAENTFITAFSKIPGVKNIPNFNLRPNATSILDEFRESISSTKDSDSNEKSTDISSQSLNRAPRIKSNSPIHYITQDSSKNEPQEKIKKTENAVNTAVNHINDAVSSTTGNTVEKWRDYYKEQHRLEQERIKSEKAKAEWRENIRNNRDSKNIITENTKAKFSGLYKGLTLDEYMSRLLGDRFVLNPKYTPVIEEKENVTPSSTAKFHARGTARKNKIAIERAKQQQSDLVAIEESSLSHTGRELRYPTGNFLDKNNFHISLPSVEFKNTPVVYSAASSIKDELWSKVKDANTVYQKIYDVVSNKDINSRSLDDMLELASADIKRLQMVQNARNYGLNVRKPITFNGKAMTDEQIIKFISGLSDFINSENVYKNIKNLPSYYSELPFNYEGKRVVGGTYKSNNTISYDEFNKKKSNSVLYAQQPIPLNSDYGDLHPIPIDPFEVKGWKQLRQSESASGTERTKVYIGDDKGVYTLSQKYIETRNKDKTIKDAGWLNFLSSSFDFKKFETEATSLVKSIFKLRGSIDLQDSKLLVDDDDLNTQYIQLGRKRKELREYIEIARALSNDNNNDFSLSTFMKSIKANVQDAEDEYIKVSLKALHNKEDHMDDILYDYVNRAVKNISSTMSLRTKLADQMALPENERSQTKIASYKQQIADNKKAYQDLLKEKRFDERIGIRKTGDSLKYTQTSFDERFQNEVKKGVYPARIEMQEKNGVRSEKVTKEEKKQQTQSIVDQYATAVAQAKRLDQVNKNILASQKQLDDKNNTGIDRTRVQQDLAVSKEQKTSLEKSLNAFESSGFVEANKSILESQKKDTEAFNDAMRKARTSNDSLNGYNQNKFSEQIISQYTDLMDGLSTLEKKNKELATAKSKGASEDLINNLRKEIDQRQQKLGDIDKFVQQNAKTLGEDRVNAFNTKKSELNQAEKSVIDAFQQDITKQKTADFNSQYDSAIEKIKELKQAQSDLVNAQSEYKINPTGDGVAQKFEEAKKKVSDLKSVVDGFYKNTYLLDKNENGVLNPKKAAEYEKSYISAQNSENKYHKNLVSDMKEQYSLQMEAEEKLIKLSNSNQYSQNEHILLSAAQSRAKQSYENMYKEVSQIYGSDYANSQMKDLISQSDISRNKTINSNFSSMSKDIDSFISKIQSAGRASNEFKSTFSSLSDGLTTTTTNFKNGEISLNDYISRMSELRDRLDYYKEYYENGIGSKDLDFSQVFSRLGKYSKSGEKSNDYVTTLNNFVDKYKEINDTFNASDKGQKAVEDYKAGIDDLVDSMKKFEKTSDGFNRVTDKGTMIENTKGQIQDAADVSKALSDYAASIGLTNKVSQSVNNATGKVVMGFETASGDVVKFTGNIEKANDSLRVMYENTTKTSTGFSSFSQGIKGLVSGNFKGAINDIAMYVGNIQIMYKAINEMQKGFNTFLDYNKALTTISYTMDMSQDQLQNLGSSAVDMAKDLSMSLDNTMDIYQIYANMNTTSKEIQETAKPTAILSNLSGVNASTAADQVQGILQQFHMLEDGSTSAADASMHVVDVMDKISANVGLDYAKLLAHILEIIYVHKPKSVKTKLYLKINDKYSKLIPR